MGAFLPCDSVQQRVPFKAPGEPRPVHRGDRRHQLFERAAFYVELAPPRGSGLVKEPEAGGYVRID